MSREQLQAAAASLRDAADMAEETTTKSRLQDQADHFDSLATADRGPDHGRLARHEHILTEIAEEEPEAAPAIDDALALIREYRSTVDGV